MSFDLLSEFKRSKPSVTRILYLVESFELFPKNDLSIQLQVRQIIKQQSQSIQYNMHQVFMMMHMYLTFDDRLSCMQVSKEWRSAIQQPICWPTFFDTTDRESSLPFPVSKRFVHRMIESSWSQLRPFTMSLYSCPRFGDAFKIWLNHPSSKIKMLTKLVEIYNQYSHKYVTIFRSQ
jgi:hypothetical protein